MRHATFTRGQTMTALRRFGLLGILAAFSLAQHALGGALIGPEIGFSGLRVELVDAGLLGG